MRSIGTAVLLVVLVSCASILIATGITGVPVMPPSVQEYVYAPTVPSVDEKVVCIVFDDGWKSQLEALPILKSHNFTATFALVTSYIGYPAYMDWTEVASVAQNGNDIVSHTYSHLNLSVVNAEVLDREIATSQQMLRSKGYAADILVYPYGEGDANQTVRQKVEQYYLLARGVNEGKCNLDAVDRYNLCSYGVYNDTTLEAFAAYLNGTQGNTITILYYHKIGNEPVNMAVTKEAFQTQMQYLEDHNYTVRTLTQQFLKPQPKP
ncbi:MAG: polysaccharide deacetylase family protein [Candidatus Bathyarchaeia archaeon]|jgi:peptidoglycan/xylan/chitin deacetylase (PgdA/CDA1 family)